MIYPSRNSFFAFFALLAGLYFSCRQDIDLDRTTMDEEKYAIHVEWFDDISSLLRTFTLFYFPADKTVEMYDMKQKRTFLKRSYCDSLTESDLYIGNVVNVFGRELKLIDYLSEATRNVLLKKTERTFAMLKPEVIPKMGKILSFIESKGFRFNKMMMTKITPHRAGEFYKEHLGRAFYQTLVNYISSGPVLAMELLAPFAITNWRKTLGPTDPEVAASEAPNSIRAHFGTDKTYNAAHGSDSPEAAQRELNFIFKNLTSYLEPSNRRTLCLIKPHVLSEGNLGALIAKIQDADYKVMGLKIHHLTPAEAEQFFIAYKGVWDDYLAHIKQFTSGPLVALCVNAEVSSFRDFIGPFDPEIARKLQPSSIRARFGHDTALNAIHCTDLPTDAAREVEFFFKMVGEYQ